MAKVHIGEAIISVFQDPREWETVVSILKKHPLSKITEAEKSKIMDEIHSAFKGAINKKKLDTINLIGKFSESGAFFGFAKKGLFSRSFPYHALALEVERHEDKVSLIDVYTGEIRQNIIK